MTASAILVLGLVVLLTRWFRGENESDQPRAWWRMTAYPPAGFVLSAWFFLTGISTLVFFEFWIMPVVWLSWAASTAIAIGYLNSSMRLIVQRNKGQFLFKE